MSTLSCFAVLLAAAGLRDVAHAENDLPVYDDALGAAWENWSWAQVDLTSTAQTHSGTTAIAVNAGPWTALYLRHVAFDSSAYGNLTFWIHGGATGGQRLHVTGTLGDAPLSSGFDIPVLAANTWQQVTIPLAALGVDGAANFSGFWIQEWTGSDQPTFYVDDVMLTRSVAVIPPPPLDHGMALFDDRFAEGWDNWSWAQVNPGNTSPVNSGTSSIAVRAGAFTALAFHHTAMDTSKFASITFWINPGKGGQLLNLRGLLSGVIIEPGFTLAPLAPANPDAPWTRITVPLDALGVAGKPDLTDLWVMEASGTEQSANPFYIDDMRLDRAPPPAIVNVTVDATRKLRTVDPRMFGLNTAVWDASFNTPTTVDLLREARNTALRFPGGSLSDVYHWQTNTSEGQTFQWATSLDAFAQVAAQTRPVVFITANYGSGSPEEAAAQVRYANVTKRYGFAYWEIGNENYGSWEFDNNTRPHDPVTYATRFKDYVAQMKAVDPSIKIGAVVLADEDSFANYPDQAAVNPRTGVTHHGWTAVMLARLAELGVTPDFVVYHRYEQAPGGESDSFLLEAARTWPRDAQALRGIVNDYLGQRGKRVELICTENNSVFSNVGKQTTSLVNALFMADAMGNVLKTEFTGFFWWDLRNGQETANNSSPSLYGWRRIGDYGIVNAAVPAGPADRYPTFYTYKLLSHFARGGERVVATTSDYVGLGVYAARDRRAHTLNLLVINKHPTAALTARIALRGFHAGGPAPALAEVLSYGIAQDEAARTGVGSADIARTTARIVGPAFTWTAAPYSATVIRLPRAHHAHHGPAADTRAANEEDEDQDDEED